MRDRPASVSRPVRGVRAAPHVTLDLVCCTIAAGRLSVLTLAPGRAGAAVLPWRALAAGSATLDLTAARWVRDLLGRIPGWIAQVGAWGSDGHHPSGAPISACYVALVPIGTEPPSGLAWQAVSNELELRARQQQMLTAAVSTIRDRMDITPVAFRLLPPEFTLSGLQEVYEVLLERRLHKASFRRALQGAQVVEAIDAWHSEGRGRPAQLFRFAPGRRRTRLRPVRFGLLG